MWYKFSLYPYYLKKEAAMKQTHSNSRRTVYFEGLRDGFPIGLGYFAVSFSLGIAARNAGLTVAQGLLSSLLCNASAGEYALFTLIGSGAACVEICSCNAHHQRPVSPYELRAQPAHEPRYAVLSPVFHRL